MSRHHMFVWMNQFITMRFSQPCKYVFFGEISTSLRIKYENVKLLNTFIINTKHSLNVLIKTIKQKL